MCGVKKFWIFSFFALGCGDDALDKSLADSIEEMQSLQIETNREKQKNEHLVRRKNYLVCDLHKRLKEESEN